MADTGQEPGNTTSDEPYVFDPDDVIGYWEGQSKPDPNAGWLKRLWYRFTGVVVLERWEGSGAI